MSGGSLSFIYVKDTENARVCGYCNHWYQNFEGSRSRGLCSLYDIETNEKQGCEEYEG